MLLVWYRIIVKFLIKNNVGFGIVVLKLGISERQGTRVILCMSLLA